MVIRKALGNRVAIRKALDRRLVGRKEFHAVHRL